MQKSLHNTICRLALPACALSLLIGGAAPVFAETAASVQTPLETAVNGSWRSEKNRARDQYRHPLQTLTFFGVTPNATVIELIPGSGAWYGEILAPFLRDHGQYIAANVARDKEDTGQKEKFANDPARFDKIKAIDFKFKTPEFGAPNSADYFLTFRNVHNFAMNDAQENLFKAMFKVLKPGGVLGIVDHRAAEGKGVAEVLKSGYLPEAYVIAEAEKAGFKLVAKSPVNNNAKDTKDYPKGVWTLPPTFAEDQKDRTKYSEIGESDRFTLRFVKPAS